MNNNSADTAHTGDPAGLDFRLDVFGSMDPRIARALLDVPSVARAVEKVHAERYLEVTRTRWRLTTTTDPSHLDRVWISTTLLEAVRVVRSEVHNFIEWPGEYRPEPGRQFQVGHRAEYLVELLDNDDAGIYTPWVVELLDTLYDLGYTDYGPTRAEDFASWCEAVEDTQRARELDPEAHADDFGAGTLLATLDVAGIPVTREAVEDASRLDVTAFLNKWVPLPDPSEVPSKFLATWHLPPEEGQTEDDSEPVTMWISKAEAHIIYRLRHALWLESLTDDDDLDSGGEA